MRARAGLVTSVAPATRSPGCASSASDTPRCGDLLGGLQGPRIAVKQAWAGLRSHAGVVGRKEHEQRCVPSSRLFRAPCQGGPAVVLTVEADHDGIWRMGSS